MSMQLDPRLHCAVQGLCIFLNHDLLAPAARSKMGYKTSAAYYRDLMAGMVLRRTKEEVQSQVHLPPCKFMDVQVTLSLPERTM